MSDSESEIVVGIDAGGSKTRVIVASLSGDQIAESVGPGAAMAPGNADACADTIAAVVAAALESAGLTEVVPRVLYAGVAGTGRESEQIALQDALSRMEIADEVVVETDASIALADAFGDRSGVILISGTGSIAFGRSPAGMLARCGGWGFTFGDEGSGAWIGRRALSVVAASHDGREPETTLTGAILTAAQVNEVEQLIPWALAADREALAALAPSVLAMAMQDDVRANSIVDMAVEELVLHVRALARKLFVDDRAAFDLALSGGLLHKGSLLRKRLERRLRVAVPGATVHVEEVDGARGAIKLALQTASAIA
ncbi:MAG TPA: BadF/BadG/BcrA/BcrD ATPase family protein [Gemmatimonadaceae bacterium]|nr:BadF/BadG/BcrA/BcrD ATPase family protein [Gemmatimonadaceae bacterium]